jgi:sugar (pentulose or hexulose) kinase
MQWSECLQRLDVHDALLPQVHAPGEVRGQINIEMARALGLPRETEITAGTTDSVAAFLAAGASAPGHGVTALGSTLVLKLLSERPIFSAQHGVYSDRLGNLWLAGGASNSGGAVLLQYFTVDQLREMASMLDPERPTGLDYYPLPDAGGERFPTNDPKMEPRLEPLPSDSLMFLQGMLEGIARIEAQGYAVLAKLGAPKLTALWTIGGGSQNQVWTRIRERALGLRIKPARSPHTAFGAALVAAGVVQKTFA